MKIEELPIADLSPDPGNVRRHSPRNLDAIKASLRRFGQQKPIVIDGNDVVRAGNGTLAAATALGWTHIKAVRTDLSGSDLVAYGIADNRSGDPEVGSTFDAEALASTLAALREEDESLLESAGYTPDELINLMGQQTPAPAPAAPADFPEFNETISTEHQCPRCKFRWSGSTAAVGGGE